MYCQVLLKMGEGQAGPFRVQLRLAGYCPKDLKLWCKPKRLCSAAVAAATDPGNCRGQEQGQPLSPQHLQDHPLWEWAAHLLLEDGTGKLSLST
jgi:hypothetical protein